MKVQILLYFDMPYNIILCRLSSSAGWMEDSSTGGQRGGYDTID